GQGGAAGPGRRRAAAGGGVGGRQVEDRGLPARARPVVVVRGALQGKRRAVGGQARPAAVVRHAAAEARRHRGRAVEAPVHWRRHRRGGRGRIVQGEADRRAGEAVPILVGGGRLDGVGAVALRGPGGRGGAAGPRRRRAAA